MCHQHLPITHIKVCHNVKIQPPINIFSLIKIPCQRSLIARRKTGGQEQRNTVTVTMNTTGYNSISQPSRKSVDDHWGLALEHYEHQLRKARTTRIYVLNTCSATRDTDASIFRQNFLLCYEHCSSCQDDWLTPSECR